MGVVITFPLEERIADGRRAGVGAPASIIILPVVRIERHVDEPSGAPRNRHVVGTAAPPHQSIVT
jgi:hypothetical protein